MKLLVVGCGSIGARHARNVAEVADLGLFDLDTERAAALAEELDALHFEEIDAALAWTPEATIIATPNDLHVPLARAALEAGSHLLIEKPIAHRPDGVMEMLSQAQRCGRSVFVACNMRFHPGPSLLRRALRGIGKPLFARAHFGNYLPNMRPGVDYRSLYCARRETGGGVILDCIHEFDYLAWLLGPVSEVACVSARLSGLEIEVEDYAAVKLLHAGGARSEIHLDYLQPVKRRGCEIVGDEGVLIWTSEGKVPESCRVRRYTKATGAWEDLYFDEDLPANDAYRRMVRAFLGVIEDGAGDDDSKHLLRGHDALNDLTVALGAHRAAESGRAQRIEWSA